MQIAGPMITKRGRHGIRGTWITSTGTLATSLGVTGNRGAPLTTSVAVEPTGLRTPPGPVPRTLGGCPARQSDPTVGNIMMASDNTYCCGRHPDSGTGHFDGPARHLDRQARHFHGRRRHLPARSGNSMVCSDNSSVRPATCVAPPNNREDPLATSPYSQTLSQSGPPLRMLTRANGPHTPATGRHSPTPGPPAR